MAEMSNNYLPSVFVHAQRKLLSDTPKCLAQATAGNQYHTMVQLSRNSQCKHCKRCLQGQYHTEARFSAN